MKAIKVSKDRWQARGYNRSTGKTKSFYAQTKKEAERLAREYQHKCSESAVNMTFAEAYDLYMKANPQWSAYTKKKYKSWRDTLFNDFLDMPLDRITEEMLQFWVDERCTKVCAKTIANNFSPIKATLKRYKPHTAYIVTLPKVGKPKLNLPSQADVELLLSAVDNTEYCVPIYLAAFGCMRRGEIAALDLNHINFDTRKIHIEFNKVYDTLKCPKNGEERTITVPQIVLDKIKEYGIPKMENLNAWSSSYGRFLDRNELPHINIHKLRHYCAARMLSLSPEDGGNIPLSVVKEYGGWRDTSVLMDIYNYVISEVRDSSMDIWNNFAEKTHENAKTCKLNAQSQEETCTKLASKAEKP